MRMVILARACIHYTRGGILAYSNEYLTSMHIYAQARITIIISHVYAFLIYIFQYIYLLQFHLAQTD